MPPTSDTQWRTVFTEHQLRNRQLCAAYALRMPPEAFFCGPTAALLQGIPLPYRLSSDRRLHVGLPEGCRAPQVVGAIGHSYRIHSGDVVSSGVGHLTSVERTWCDLARYLSLEDLVAAGDYLIQHSRPLTSIERLTSAVNSLRGQRGAKNLRRALTLLSDRAESPKESVLRVHLVLAGLPTPEVNMNVYDDRGAFLARADLMFRKERLILEYEGLQHLLDADQWQRDIQRVRRLEAAGWRVIRVTQADLRDSSALIALVRTHLERTPV